MAPTSGNSPNLIEAQQLAKGLGLTTLGFAGEAGGAMLGNVDHLFRAPSFQPQIVQQLHIAAAHAVLGALERHLFAGMVPA